MIVTYLQEMKVEHETLEVGMDQDLIRPDALAREWDTTTGALAQMRYLGQGPRFIKIGSKSVRYRRSDITAWLDQQTRQQTGEQVSA